tara:strand:+ start:44 stop:601 length:558 start_codon:yes stop_codon:yes gene_type:complete
MSKEESENDGMISDEKWTNNTGPCTEFNVNHAKDKNEDVQEVIELAELQIKRGSRKPELRKDMWIALRKTYDGLPEGYENPMPHGRTSAKYLSIQEGLTAVKNIAEAAQAAVLTVPNANFLMFERTGKGDEQLRFALSNEEQIAKAGTSAVQRFKNLYDADIWDGTEAGLANIATDARPEETSDE